MAKRDVAGGKGNKALSQAFDNARETNEQGAEQASNLVVGEFLAELASAIRFRMKIGQSYGDWVEEPARMFSDGLIFATEEAVASSVKLQITVSLDVSTSMWMNGIMKYAGPAFIALDRVIRKSMMDLPEGSVHYAPFVFHGEAFEIPAAFLNMYAGELDYKGVKLREGQRQHSVAWPNHPRVDLFEAAIAHGQIPRDSVITRYQMSGAETKVAPLFEAIEKWEKEKGDTSAVRLDIVLTDGVLESVKDVEAATRVQERRNGKLRTVMLNFLDPKEWGEGGSKFSMPSRCNQYAVTPERLTSSIRDILSEAVGDLF